MPSKKSFLFLVLGTFLPCLSVIAQLTAGYKKEVITSIGKILEKKYVFPQVAQKMQDTLTANYTSKKYDTITTGGELAFQLTRDLQIVSGDQHIKISFSEKKQAAPEKKDTSATKSSNNNSYSQWLDQLLRDNNYGVKEKKILPGNIGYLSIPMFGPLDKCADSLIAAMDFVSNTDALLIDLQSCRGSLDENTIPFFSSYFFKEPVQLSDFYVRESNTRKQFWTMAWMPGKRYLNKPVYIITSGRTFSGGEAFAYDMQQLKRAQLIGETTRGGANPSELTSIDEQFKISVPYASPISPITGTNWEGAGVRPDTLIKSNKALYEAQLLALQNLLQRSPGTAQKEALILALKTLKENEPQFRHVRFELKGYEQAKEVAVAGSFNAFARKSFFLQKKGSKWVGETDVEPGELRYVFIVDGRFITDPENPKTVKENGQVNSVKTIQ